MRSSVAGRRVSALVVLVGLGGLVACGSRVATVQCDCSPAAAAAELGPGEGRPASLISGPMLGYATHREVAIWLATDGPSEVRVVFWPEDEPGSRTRTAPSSTESSRDDTHLVRVTLLDPGRWYGFELEVDGRRVGERGRFRTQALWRWNAYPPRPPEFTFAFGSCAYINEERFDRAGTPYGGQYEIFDGLASVNPDLMLWLGDNVYFREADWTSRASMEWRYRHDRALAELQGLLSATHHYAIWDDHDFGPNDSDRSFEFGAEALELFESYWANPSYGLPHAPGAYTRFTWADAEFFLLDDRTYRAANAAPDGPDKPYLGDAQLAWLLDGLSSSTATFKFVVNGNQVLNDNGAYEGYHEYGSERARLLEGLVERGVDGVVFLSGDRHHSELLRVERDGAYPLFEYTSSPLTSGVGDARFELDNPLRVEGTLVNTTRNFGTISVVGAWGDRTLVLRAHGPSGDVLWEHRVHQSELRSPGLGD